MSNDGWVSVSVMPVLSERSPTDHCMCSPASALTAAPGSQCSSSAGNVGTKSSVKTLAPVLTPTTIKLDQHPSVKKFIVEKRDSPALRKGFSVSNKAISNEARRSRDSYTRPVPRLNALSDGLGPGRTKFGAEREGNTKWRLTKSNPGLFSLALRLPSNERTGGAVDIPQRKAQPQQFVPRSNPNTVPQGYAHHQHQHTGHARRASYPEAPRKQALYQLRRNPITSSQSIQMTGPTSNPLQYSAQPVQYASSPQPGNTQTVDAADVDQSKQTPERREAMRYQRELEDSFLKGLCLDGEEVEPEYVPSDLGKDDEDDRDTEFEDEGEHEPKLQYHHSH
ncbi:hypothetical protein FRC09_006168 [Ceratobasidium sp. 395]|nr:hypothetical protein FRC09_006168 [Ceratobasidium sp. 395]